MNSFSVHVSFSLEIIHFVWLKNKERRDRFLLAVCEGKWKVEKIQDVLDVFWKKLFFGLNNFILTRYRYNLQKATYYIFIKSVFANIIN